MDGEQEGWRHQESGGGSCRRGRAGDGGDPGLGCVEFEVSARYPSGEEKPVGGKSPEYRRGLQLEVASPMDRGHW